MALYHKYRPQIFADVVGQSAIIKTVTSQIITSSFAHAYIFSGSRGSGKTTTARLLAKALNCTNRAKESAEPCNSCQMCETITAGKNIDVLEIDAASHTGVDNVRENIIENAQFQPTLAKYKVFIIDEVHMLSTSAFNALLKTLEEPPAYVVFILATTELHKIPETILSRCQRYTFSKVPRVLLTETVRNVAGKEGVTLDDAVIDAIVAKADGGVRDALGLLDQMISLGQKNITRAEASIFLPMSPLSDAIAFLGQLLERKSAECFETLERLAGQSVDMPALLDTLIEVLRLLMITKIQGSGALESDLSSEAREALAGYAKNVSGPELVSLIDIALKRRASIKTLPLPLLALELLVVEWSEGAYTQVATSPDNTGKGTLMAPPQATLVPAKPVFVPDAPKPSPTVEKTEIKTEEGATPAPTETEAKVETTEVAPVSASLAAIQQKWGNILKCLEVKSRTLVSLLKGSKLIALDGNTLTLEVPFKLHQDKLNQKEYKKMFEESLLESLGSEYAFQAVVAAKESSSADSTDLQNLAAAFGGVVV